VIDSSVERCVAPGPPLLVIVIHLAKNCHARCLNHSCRRHSVATDDSRGQRNCSRNASGSYLLAREVQGSGPLTSSHDKSDPRDFHTSDENVLR